MSHMADFTDPMILHGYAWPRDMGVTEEKVAVFPRLPARKDDIFIVSYPRSGSSWTQEIVWEILHDGKIDDRPLDERMPLIEGLILAFKPYPYVTKDVKSMEKTFASFPVPRVFKTHLTYDIIPKGSDEATKPRYIYVMRNPKDVFVSLYHHHHNMPYFKEISTWDDAFEHFMDGKFLGGLWFDHVLGWWKHRNEPNILFQTYEDRMKNPADAVEKIAKFIGKELSPETRYVIVRQTSFGAMKSSNHTNYNWFKGMKGDGHVRKGKVGEWKNYFTEEQNQLFDKVFIEKMKDSGITLEYDG